MTARAAELAAERVPFVLATVVRAQPPTSVRPGDDAVVLADGEIEGFVGGHCAMESVRAAALDVFESGEALLVRILPEGEAEFPDAYGARVVVNPCLSGGAIEVLLEPRIPAHLISIVGETPIADALASMAESLGFAFESVRSLARSKPDGALAVVVCSPGKDEPESIRSALDAGVQFVGLVASRKRGEAVLSTMELTPAERSRIHTPVGLDIGARTPEEIALSIMAELVKEVRTAGLAARKEGPGRLFQFVDPVCGMTVVVGPDTPHSVVAGTDVWFCSPSCRDHYAA